MPIQLLNPEGLSPPVGYSHVAVASGSRMVFTAGQVARNVDGTLVGPNDYAAQTRQAVLNVGTALEAAGASEADLVKLTIYVVGYRPEVLPLIFEGVVAAGAERPAPEVPGTLVGVERLSEDGFLIEVEAIAMLA